MRPFRTMERWLVRTHDHMDKLVDARRTEEQNAMPLSDKDFAASRRHAVVRNHNRRRQRVDSGARRTLSSPSSIHRA